MTQTRAKKVAESIKEVVSEIIAAKIKDPRVGFTTVTGVEASKDLRYCTINVSILGNETEQEDTMKTLVSAAGFIRSELGSRIRIRHIPELRFVQDKAMEHHAHINNLIRQIKEGTDGQEN
jgi:ribosome-binding factor A